MTHGIDRRQTRSLYFGQITHCPICGYADGSLFGIYRKSPSGTVWWLKKWRILHHGRDSPCTRFYRTSCEVSKENIKYMGNFQWGSGKPFPIRGDWSIPAHEFPCRGRYINPFTDAQKFIALYGVKRWREVLGPEIADGFDFTLDIYGRSLARPAGDPRRDGTYRGNGSRGTKRGPRETRRRRADPSRRSDPLTRRRLS